MISWHLDSPHGAVTACEPNQCPSLPADLLCPMDWQQTCYGSHKLPQLHRLGQTGGGTTAKKLIMPVAEVRHDHEDATAVGRELEKSLVVLPKVQDSLITTANSAQNVPEFKRELEGKPVLIPKSKVSPFQDWQDGWNAPSSWAPEQSREIMYQCRKSLKGDINLARMQKAPPLGIICFLRRILSLSLMGFLFYGETSLQTQQQPGQVFCER